MSCPIPEIIRQDLANASAKFIGNSTTFYVDKPGVIVMPTANKFSTYVLKQIAINNAKRTNEFMSKKYPDFAGENWIEKIEDMYHNKVVVRLNFPKRLEHALYVKDELMSIEDVNAELLARDLESLGEDRYLGDNQLRSQEEKNMNDFDVTYLVNLNKKRPC